MHTHKHQAKNRDHVSILFFPYVILLLAFCVSVSPVHAVPETSAVRITDVTPSSFSVVWMTDVAAEPTVEVYSDSSMQQQITEGIVITSMPAGDNTAVEAARTKGIMKVRVSGVQPSTTYYVRTVTGDPADPDSISYSPVQPVTTASGIALYRTVDSSIQPVENDLVAFPVYIRGTETGLGDLVLLEEQEAAYPVTAFVGDGVASPEGVLDLNNLFGNDGSSLRVSGSEKITLTIYREGDIASLTHYRKAPQNSDRISVVSLISGFFADINIDGKVDDQDFQLFKAQYRTAPNDAVYNPDYNFVDDTEGSVDVREYGKFSKEYGRTDVQ